MTPSMKKNNTKTDRSSNIRKSTFRAVLTPHEDSIVRALKAELQLTSNSDFLSDALALLRWAVLERKRGHVIVSESFTGERKILVLPRLECVAPELTLPHLDIRWNDKELESLAKLASGQPARPTGALVLAMNH